MSRVLSSGNARGATIDYCLGQAKDHRQLPQRDVGMQAWAPTRLDCPAPWGANRDMKQYLADSPPEQVTFDGWGALSSREPLERARPRATRTTHTRRSIRRLGRRC